MTRFPLSSDQCEILCALDACKSIGALAEFLKRDPSVVSRQLKKIAETAPVLEKIQGRWTITSIGHQVILWTKDSSTALSRIFQNRTAIRVGATREFASRVICPQIKTFLKETSNGAELVLNTYEAGIEEALLCGEIDFGFDCGRPKDPLIQFKLVTQETFGIFGSSTFFRSKKPKALSDLLSLPNLHYHRVPASRYLRLASDVPNVVGYFNDLAAIRETCCAGLGWAVLPDYAVQREVKAGLLIRIDLEQVRGDSFGVWWLRGAKVHEDTIQRAIRWLVRQNL
jgi:DNA-binding transcriptional LysR family regulator